MPSASITEREFPKEVLGSDTPVLVTFRAGWCAPSQDLEPVFDAVASEYDGRAKVVALDVDGDIRANRVCRRFGVTRLPVTMLFADGRPQDFIGGMTSKESVTEMLENRLKPVFDVSEHSFDTEVLRSPVPVLVHFRAAWCQASLEVEPVIESVAERVRGRARVAAVDFDRNARLCARYGIVRVPTIALFERGEIKDRIFGAMKGGTKEEGGRLTSCVNLTSAENVSQMLEEFVL